MDLYTRAVEKLTRPQGIFLITSCNFTKDELVARFTAGNSGEQEKLFVSMLRDLGPIFRICFAAAFEVERVVPAPTFTFVSGPIFIAPWQKASRLTRSSAAVHLQGGQSGSSTTTVAFRKK